MKRVWSCRIAAFGLVTGCLILTSAGTAAAKTAVSVNLDDRFDVSELVLQGGPGQDDVTVTDDGVRYTIESDGGVVAGDNCEQVWPSIVRCPGASPFYESLFRADMSSGDDRLLVAAASVFRSTVHGDRGDDRLKVRRPGRLLGGPGADALIGSSASDLIRGGKGGDNLVGRDGGDLIIGGLGSDWAQGDGGQDRIHEQDGVADHVARCGSGADRVVLDLRDPSAAGDCETVKVGG